MELLTIFYIYAQIRYFTPNQIIKKDLSIFIKGRSSYFISNKFQSK